MQGNIEVSPSGEGSSSQAWDLRIEAAREGSREAMGWLFAAVRAYLRAMAGQRLDPQLQVKTSPSDLVQETLLEAYEHFDRFTGQSRGELILWLQGILNNRLLTVQRSFREASKRDLRRERPLPSASTSDRRVGDVPDPMVTSPSGQVMASENYHRVNQALTELPPRYEQVIRLRNELKLSFQEVATAMSCTPAAAQKLWSRAIDRLARELRDHEHF